MVRSLADRTFQLSRTRSKDGHAGHGLGDACRREVEDRRAGHHALPLPRISSPHC